MKYPLRATRSWKQPIRGWWAAALCLLLLSSFSSAALAANNDLYLHYLYEGRTTALTAKQQKSFRLLSTEFGFAIHPTPVSPAETLGASGFDFGLEFSLADIPELSEHWRRAVEDERPDNQLFMTRIRFRKGLPFSFELDANVSFLYDSSMVMATLGVKWALFEGYSFFPDIAIRASITRAFNSRDVDIFTTSADVLMSKQFGIVGTLTITPYAAYSFLYVRSGSKVLDPTPKNFNDNDSRETGNFVFNPENIFGHRFSFGVRFVWFITSLTFEGSFSLPDFSISGNANETFQLEDAATIGAFNMKFSVFF
jgi:hypothetical protein